MLRDTNATPTREALADISSKFIFATHHDQMGSIRIVPDSELLFSGQYTRSGNDLVLSHDGRRLVVPDYFGHGKLGTLSSPEGATLSGQVVELLAGSAQYAQAGPGTTGGATPIGRVEMVSGTATVVRNGVATHLNVGDLVFKNDVIETGVDSAAGIGFVDGTAFRLSAHARMVLNEFVYDPNGSSNSALLTLVQGSIGFIAGKVAKTGDMKVDTPIATLGIRGTAVGVDIPLDLTATNGTVRLSVMIELDGTSGAFEVLDRVTGAPLANVNLPNLMFLLTPTVPGQPPAIATALKTPIDFANEQQVVRNVSQYATDVLQNPINANPQTAPGSGTPPPNNPNNNLNGVPEKPLAQNLGGTTSTALNNTSSTQSTQSTQSTIQLPLFLLASTSGIPVFDLAPQIAPTQIAKAAALFGVHTQTAINGFDPSISADGRFIVFEAATTVPATGAEQAGPAQVVLFDRTTHTYTPLGPNITGEFYSNPSISLDGNYAVFQGQSQNGAQPVIYIYDRITKQATPLTAPNSGDPISGSAAHISADGQFITMQHAENGVLHVLVTDRNGTILDDISSTGGVNSPNISANGRFVTFWSTDSKIEVNGSVAGSSSAGGAAKLYVFDRVTGTVSPVAVLFSGEPNNAAALETSASMSADGRFIVFASDAESPLVPGGPEGHANIFIYDQTTGQIRNLSIADHGGAANGDSVMPQISADDRFVTFSSSASNLVANNTHGVAQTYLYNLTTHTLTLASANARGVLGNGASSFGSAVSTDGIIVSLSSLTSNIKPPTVNLYVLDESAGTAGTVVDDPSVHVLTTSGKLYFSDTAHGATYTVSVAPQAGAEGTLTAAVIQAPTGAASNGQVEWIYHVAEAQAATLAAGQSEVNTFSIVLNDGTGGVTSQNVTVTIIGTRPLVTEPIFWTNGNGGSFENAANWSTSAVPGLADQVLIDDHSATDPNKTYTVTSTSDHTIATLGIVAKATLSIVDSTFVVTNGSASDNAGTVTVGDNAAFEVSGALQNSGTISLQASLHAAATFLIDGDVSLSGGGFLSLTGPGLSTVAGVGAGASLENVDNTISGSGLLGDGSLAITNDAHGIIDATGTIDQPGVKHQLVIDTGGSFFTNDGVVDATGPAGMLIQNTTVTNNRIVEVSGSSSLEVDGAFNNTFAASIEVDNSASFSATSVVNDNLITVNDQGSFTAVNNLTNGDPTLLDLGIISMNSSGTVTSELITNTFFGEIEVNSGELIDSSITTAGFLDVFGVAAVHSGVMMDNSGDVTIHDSAAIYNTVELINESVGFITLSGFATMHDGSNKNSGQIELFDSSTVVDNVLNNTDIGFIFLFNSATFTVSGGGTNAGSILVGNFGVGQDANFELAGTLDNSGRIELDGSGAGIVILAGGATLQGGGQIALLGGTISGPASGATLTNVDNTISGFGNIGDGSNDLTLVNEGIIDGNDKSMTLDTGSNLITNAGMIQAITNAIMIQASAFSALQIDSPISNTGTMEAVSFASLDIKGSLDNSGTVEASSGGILTIDGATTNSGTVEASSGGILTVNGVTTNSGLMKATDNGTLKLLSDLNNTGTLMAQDGNIVVDGASGSGHAQISDGTLEYDALSSLATDFDAGAVGGLKLLHSAEFSGTVTGFALGDYYDLEDIAYSSATTPSYVPTGANTGILYVQDGEGHTAAIVMNGDYTSGDFFKSSDPNGGTYITETRRVSWLSAADGDFADFTKWDSGFVPTSVDDAFITAAGATYTVTSLSVESVNSISIGADATLAIGGSSTFTVANGTEFGSIAGQVTVDDGSTLALHWRSDNSGVISLNSNGDATTLSIVGSTTLSGQGHVNLTDNANNVITGAGAGAMLTNVDNTISGSGQLGGGQLTLVNDQLGTIDAAGTDAPLIIDTQGNVVINDGALEATGLAGLVIADTTVDSSGGGFVSKAKSGGTVELQSGVVAGGTIDGLVHVIGGDSVLDGTNGTVTIDGTGDVEVLDRQQLTLRSSINIGHGGIIKLDASGDNTTLLIDAAGVSLAGGGSIELSNDGHNIITGVTANATLTNVDDTISGSGLLGNGQLTLVNEANGFIVATGATNALIIDTEGEVLVNDGTLKATGAAGLEIEDTTVDGSRGFVGDIVADAGSLVELNGATLLGGTLISHGDGVITVIDGANIFDGTNAGGLTNSAAVEVLDGKHLTMRGSITNTDSISLESTGGVTTLMIDSEGVTLNGGGTIHLSDNGNNIITGATAGAELDNVDNTISGSGQLGDGQLTVRNKGPGIIDASGDNAQLVIDTQGSTFTNDGTLEATGHAGLVIEDTTVDSSGGGNVSISGSGGTVELQNSVLLGGKIDGLVHVTGGDSVLEGTNGAVTIDATGDVEVLDGQQLTLRSGIGISDGGIIGLDASGNTTTTLLIDAAGASLGGGGAIELSDDAHNVITGVTATATLTNVDDTIEGSGLLGNGQLTLVNEANGVIVATGDANALTVDTEGEVLVNDGTLKATGAAGLIIENTTVDGSGGGVIDGDGGAVELQNATIVGGSLEGAIDTGSSASTLDGTKHTVTNLGSVTVGDGDQLVLSGTIDNSGSILLDSQGKATTLEIGTANATLDGGGQLSLSSDSLIIGLDPTATLTNDNNGIVGSGELGNGQLTFINEIAGTVNANASAAPLVLDTQGSVVINDGILEASKGGQLIIRDTTVDGSGGGFIEANGANSVTELQNADVVGGTLATSGGGSISVVDSTFDGTHNKIVTNTGNVVVGDGQQLALKGTLDNAGPSAVINIDASGHDTTLSIAGTVTLEGATTLSEVALSDDAHNIIAGSGPGATLINQDIILGAGTIDGSNLTLSNQKGGVIDASGTTALTLDFQGSAISNAGTLGATATGGLSIEGDVKNATGLIEADGGNISVSGDVTGGNVIIVDATVDVSGALSADVNFATSTGILKLGAPALFTGKISGFTGNGTLAGSDQIDLTNIDHNSAHFNGTFNSATDTLTVSDGTHTAHLKFVGTYSQDNFSFASDGDGGTIVYDPPTFDQLKPTVEVANDAFIFHAGASNHIAGGLASGSAEADRIEPGGAANELDHLLTAHLAEIGSHEAFIDVGHGDPAPWVGIGPVSHHAFGFMLH